MIKKHFFIAKGINVSSRMIDGLSYIYLEDRKQLLQLNEIGSFIWEVNAYEKTVYKTCDRRARTRNTEQERMFTRGLSR